MPSMGSGPGLELTAMIERLAQTAGQHADDVDLQSRFPAETIGEAKAQGLLGAPIPAASGGMGLDFTELCRIVGTVAEACSSSGMVLAMHYSQLLCLLHHGRSATHLELLSQCAKEQLLLASATTERNVGGDTRSSSCAVEPLGAGAIALSKSCPVISYGRFADAILVTARRDPSAVPNDQVLVYLPAAQFSLEKTSGWDALGMRGTCSEGFELRAESTDEYVLSDGYETISSETAVPAAHILWASAWLGMASQAGKIARGVVQKAAKRTPGSIPPSALRLAELEVQLQSMTALVRSSALRYQQDLSDPASLNSLQSAISMNTLKVAAAEFVRKIVGDAMVIVGMPGFANKSPMSLARLYRDSIAPSIMINNDRILQQTSTLQLISRGAR